MRSSEARLFICVATIAAVLIAIAMFPMLTRTPKKWGVTWPDPVLDRKVLIPEWSRLRGNANAAYTLVEFGDYQCPPCASIQPDVDAVLTRFNDRLNYVFHFMRVDDTHYNAEILAMAAAAAGEQGKFWEMHDLLMKNRKSLADPDQAKVAETVMELATRLKLNEAKFREAFGGDKARDSVARQSRLGGEVHVMGTPSFYLIANSDGKAVIRSNYFTDLKKWLDNPSNWPVPDTRDRSASRPG